MVFTVEVAVNVHRSAASESNGTTKRNGSRDRIARPSTGEVVVITGASAGIGRATVRAFARQGASIGLIARGLDGLIAAKREVEALGGRAEIFQADVSDAAQVEAAADAFTRALGPIDIWVNNAMVSVFSPVDAMEPDDYRRVTEVTYLGYVFGTMAALRRMRSRDRGVIVQVGSALAHRAIPLQSAYCAAKHAIKGFTESLVCELLHDGSGIHVTMVELPAINTPQFDWVKSRLPNRAQPVPPIFQPELAAEAIVYAARARRRSVWLGFSTLKAIVGTRIAPAIADRYLAKNGVRDQQTSEREPGSRPDNLWAPCPGDRGAHGRFDDRAKSMSAQFALSRLRIPFALAAVGLVASFALYRRASR